MVASMAAMSSACEMPTSLAVMDESWSGSVPGSAGS